MHGEVSDREVRRVVACLRNIWSAYAQPSRILAGLLVGYHILFLMFCWTYLKVSLSAVPICFGEDSCRRFYHSVHAHGTRLRIKGETAFDLYLTFLSRSCLISLV